MSRVHVVSIINNICVIQCIRLKIETLYAYIKLVILSPAYSYKRWCCHAAYHITMIVVVDYLTQGPSSSLFLKELNFNHCRTM